jgi:DNA polymerase I
MTSLLDSFEELWVTDTEFNALPGEILEPICVVAHELHTGRRIRLWCKDGPAPEPFYSSSACIVAFHASAEISTFLVLGWPAPAEVVCLSAEFRCQTAGTKVIGGRNLLAVAARYGHPTMTDTHKEEMRSLCQRGGAYSVEEKSTILDYCADDVEATKTIFFGMVDSLPPCPALLRGRYTIAVSQMELRGIPVNVGLYRRIQRCWPEIKTRLIEETNAVFNVFDSGVFKQNLFAQYLAREGIPWPSTDTGRLKNDDVTWKTMVTRFPQLQALMECFKVTKGMRLFEFPVGMDGRNRTLISQFGSLTSRNQPSSSRFIFGASRWVRHLIQPREGMSLAYVDWKSQEFGIAAALSGDDAALSVYEADDPYTQFGIDTGWLPPGATKQSRPVERQQLKIFMLAVQYGARETTIAHQLRADINVASDLMRRYKTRFKRLVSWLGIQRDRAFLQGKLQTTFGWSSQFGDRSKALTAQNFCVQGNGAEMMRLAAIYANQAGVPLCAPVHDAFLIEAPEGQIREEVATLQAAMNQASRDVLDGYTLRTDIEVTNHPGHFQAGGRDFWDRILALTKSIEGEAALCAS